MAGKIVPPHSDYQQVRARSSQLLTQRIECVQVPDARGPVPPWSRGIARIARHPRYWIGRVRQRDRPRSPRSRRRRPAAGASLGLEAAGRVHGGGGAAAARRHPDHGRAAVGRARPVGQGQLDLGGAQRLLRGLRAAADPGRRARRPLRRAASGARSGLALFAIGAAAGAVAQTLRRADRRARDPGRRRRTRQPRRARRRGLGLPRRASRRARWASGARAPACRTWSGRCSAAC